MITQEDFIQRKLSFRDIEQLVHNNPVVAQFVDMYAHGVIVSKEEALYQMVRELAKTREELFKDRVNEEMMRTYISIPNTFLKPNDP